MIGNSLIHIILEALFPIHHSERELASYGPEQAYDNLPPAPATSLAHASAIFAYKDPCVTQLVWSIKYKKSSHSVLIAGYALYKTLTEKYCSDRESPVVIIPIPISNRRRKERGYNQCELLTDEIQRLDITHRFTILNNALIRSRHVSRQTLKNRTERLESTGGIFSTNEEVLDTIDRRSLIIIIDDVITTEIGRAHV